MAALTVDEAFAHCESRVRSHYENFPVGLFVPKDKRRYVHALYAFARARGKPVLCFAHVTNQMGRIEGALKRASRTEPKSRSRS